MQPRNLFYGFIVNLQDLADQFADYFLMRKNGNNSTEIHWNNPTRRGAACWASTSWWIYTSLIVKMNCRKWSCSVIPKSCMPNPTATTLVKASLDVLHILTKIVNLSNIIFYCSEGLRRHNKVWAMMPCNFVKNVPCHNWELIVQNLNKNILIFVMISSFTHINLINIWIKLEEL